VTGVSTGALLAPLVFLGPKYDAALTDVYTNIDPTKIYEMRFILAALTDDALSDTAPLYETISRFIDGNMIAKIAAEYEKGRLLLIQTTDLDAGRPVQWNIGAIAASGNPRALDLIRHILLASASIPAAFPPVMFDVEANGTPYEEMHVDTMGFNPIGLRAAVEMCGVDRVVFGSDYGAVPYGIEEHVRIVEDVLPSPAERQQVFWKTSNRIFRLGLFDTDLITL
jgi:predicted acylesterase/phospholipase RssA